MKLIKNVIGNYRFRLKRYIIKLLKANDGPETVALSYAIGTFIAVFPTPGFSTLIILAVAVVFKRLSKISLLAGQLVWNAFTVLPIYWISIEIGKWIFPSAEREAFQWEWLSVVIHFTKTLLIGNLFVSIPLSYLSYFLAKWIYVKFLNTRMRKKVRRGSALKDSDLQRKHLAA